jgi:hypothetical protein
MKQNDEYVVLSNLLLGFTAAIIFAVVYIAYEHHTKKKTPPVLQQHIGIQFKDNAPDSLIYEDSIKF